MIDVAIVGGGLTGLTLAYSLKKRGLSVTVLESAPRVGGVIASDSINGFLTERGPHTLVVKESSLELLRELGLGEEVVYPAPEARDRFLWNREREALIPFPGGPLSAVTTPLLSFQGKVRLLAEVWTRAKSFSADDESVASFFRRRFGGEIERIVSAALSGVWAADITRLSMRSALPKVWMLEQNHGSVIRGALGGGRRNGAPRERKKFITLRDGLESLPRAFASKLGEERVQRNAAVSSVDFSTEGALLRWRDGIKNEEQEVRARHVVLTLPAWGAAELLSPHDKALSEQIAAVPYAPISVINVAFDRTDTEKARGFGFLSVPKSECALLGGIFTSSLFPSRAPQGRQLVSCFVGGGVNPHLSDAGDPRIQASVLSEVHRVLSAKHPPEVISVQHWPRAIPNYPLGHHHLVEAVERFQKARPQLTISANWLRGISLSDRLEDGLRLGEQLGAKLGG